MPTKINLPTPHMRPEYANHPDIRKMAHLGAEAAKRLRKQKPYLNQNSLSADPIQRIRFDDEVMEVRISELVFICAKMEGLTDIAAFQRARPNNQSVSAQGKAVSAYRFARRENVRRMWEYVKRSGFVDASAESFESYVARCFMREQQAMDMKQPGAAASFMRIQGQVMGWLGSGDGDRNQQVQLDPGEVLLQVRANLGEDAANRLALSLGMAQLSPPPEPGQPGQQAKKDVTPPVLALQRLRELEDQTA